MLFSLLALRLEHGACDGKLLFQGHLVEFIVKSEDIAGFKFFDSTIEIGCVPMVEQNYRLGVWDIVEQAVYSWALRAGLKIHLFSGYTGEVAQFCIVFR